MRFVLALALVCGCMCVELTRPVLDAQTNKLVGGYPTSEEGRYVILSRLFDHNIATEARFKSSSAEVSYTFHYPARVERVAFHLSQQAKPESDPTHIEVYGTRSDGEKVFVRQVYVDAPMGRNEPVTFMTYFDVPLKSLSLRFMGTLGGKALRLGEIAMFGDVLPTPIVAPPPVTWVDLGVGMVAVGDDCPFLQRGDWSSLEACESSCLEDIMCNVINYSPGFDCVFRSCTDPKNPQLSKQSGYTAYTSGRPVPGPPCSSGSADTCGVEFNVCHCTWNSTTCNVSKAPYALPSNATLLQMTGTKTLMKPNMRFAFYGDSITWLGFYENQMMSYIKASPVTMNYNITLINRGINGGTVTDLVRGYSPWGNSTAFLEALKIDKPTVAAVQIGINDVWQTNRGNNLTVFTQVLSDEIVKPALAMGIKLYLAAVSVIGERVDGENPFDTQLDQYAASQAAIAKQFNIPFVPLRALYQGYDAVNNCLNLYNGVLTYDGVHPTIPDGATMLANSHAGGILACLAQ